MASAYAHITGIERRVSGLLSAGHCPVFDALARNPNGNIEEVYFKLVENRGILNELIAPRIAEHFKIPVAETYACGCPEQLLAEHMLSSRVDNDEYRRGVASVAASAVRYYGADALVKLERDLLEWKKLPQAAVFDELIMNTDRNFQNVLRLGSGNFILIDHEQALGGPENILNARAFQYPSDANYLASLVFNSGHEFTIKRMYSIAESFSDTADKLFIDEMDTLDLVAKLPSGSAEQLVVLIKQRAKRLVEFLGHHRAMNDMFALSSN